MVTTNEAFHRSGERLVSELPPRSRLYCLTPMGVGTFAVESLTSYINRLARTYRISPRVLVKQEIIPHLKGTHHIRSSPSYAGPFCHARAMSVNGAGEVAVDWSNTLENLTMHSDLRSLTIHPWAEGLPGVGLLRTAPAWCPECYHEWRQEERPLYQPLLWMLQVATICPRHKKRLLDVCSRCRKHQALIASKTAPGFCTHCMAWLGIPSGVERSQEIDDEAHDWQEWVMNAFEELCQAAVSSPLPWKAFSSGLAACLEEKGERSRIGRLAGGPPIAISAWLCGARMPSFKRVLEICYVLNVSPLRLMTVDLATLKASIQTRQVCRQLPPRRTTPVQVKREDALMVIHAVLGGREAPLSISQIERRLGLGHRTLALWFPQECGEISARYQAYRAEQVRQRMTRGCDEIRQVALELHAQGKTPTQSRVKALLSDPHGLRKPEGWTTWRNIRRELGIKTRFGR